MGFSVIHSAFQPMHEALFHLPDPIQAAWWSLAPSDCQTLTILGQAAAATYRFHISNCNRSPEVDDGSRHSGRTPDGVPAEWLEPLASLASCARTRKTQDRLRILSSLMLLVLFLGHKPLQRERENKKQKASRRFDPGPPGPGSGLEPLTLSLAYPQLAFSDSYSGPVSLRLYRWPCKRQGLEDPQLHDQA